MGDIRLGKSEEFKKMSQGEKIKQINTLYDKREVVTEKEAEEHWEFDEEFIKAVESGEVKP